ncbi:MAG: hypothetical protein V2I67_06305 [Thermoanaerobaculales bacterium]|nr:hypothetical protein [Thermoanaerobaculales bacterium]
MPPTKVATAPVAQVSSTLYLGAAAHIAGAADTDWRSDCEVLCTGPEACAFTIEALMHGQANPNPASRDVTLAAGEALRFDDILLGEFGTDGKAALRIRPSAGAIVATNRTYNLLAAGNGLGLPAGSTFGQYIPAVPGSDAIAFGEEGRLIQLSHSTSGGGFRTNLGLVNVTGGATDIRIELYDAAGDRLGVVNRDLEPYEYLQVGNVFSRVTSSDVPNGYAVVRTTTEDGRFLAQASVVDNATGDPVFVPAQRLLAGAGPKAVRPPQVIAAAAHIAGAADTNWRTDVELHNASDTPAQVTVDLLKHGRDNANPTSESVFLAAGESRRFEDILETLFSFSGKAALRFHTSGGEVVVSSRTYNLIGAKRAAALPPGSTFGQYIPAVTEAEAIHRGDTGLLVQLAQSADDASGFRANLALVNARTTPVTVDVEAFTADGTPLGAFAVALRPLEYRQLNSVFREVTSAAVDDGYLKVGTTTDGGAFFALASVVDNLTGDPVGMLHARVVAGGAQSVIDGAMSIFTVLGGTVGDDGELVGLPDVVAVLQDQDIDDLLDDVAAGLPNASASGGVLTTNFGSGWADENGSVHTGTMTVDLSGFVVTSSSISGTIFESHMDHLIDGEAPDIGWLEAEFDLDIDPQGEVQGTIGVAGGPPGAPTKVLSGATIAGNIVIDTILCRYFPTGGALTFTIGDFSTTITFTPNCDGSFDYDSDPRWDWLWQAYDPDAADSRFYLQSTSNAIIRTEGGFRFWQPEVGGETFATTTPGTVIYRFPFERPVVAARGGFGIFTFHWSYSRGHGFLYGSTNGVDWELIAETEPPEYGGWNRNGNSFEVPESLLGGSELWFKAELYSYGSSAPNGGGSTNTAQLGRYEIASDPVTAWLQVDLE